jgi:hypothetical protein
VEGWKNKRDREVMLRKVEGDVQMGMIERKRKTIFLIVFCGKYAS